MKTVQAIEILTNALQSDESKYTAEIDKALSIVQRVFAKIPEKHGRLIDADAIDYDDYFDHKMFTMAACKSAQKIIEEQPTVIESEE